MNHLTAAQQEALAEASRDRLNFAARLEPVLTLAERVFADGDEDFEDLVESCSYGEEDGIAVVLTATVLGRLDPQEYEQEECRLDWRVTRDDGSVEVLPGFLGDIVDMVRVGPSTNIIAGTEGYEAERTPIGESKADDREYAGFRPDTVLYDIASVLPYAGIEMPRIAEPVLYNRDEPFSWTRPVKDVTDWVESQANLRAADRPWNVAAAYALKAPEGEPSWDFEQDRDFGYGELTEETPEGERYARVVVARMEGEGSATEGTETKLAEAKVDNGGRRVNPRSVLVLPYEAESEDGSENTRTAYAMAYEEATRLSGLPVNVSVAVNYPLFFLSRGKILTGTSKDRYAGNVISSRYFFRADKVVVDAVAKKGSVSGEGRLLSTDEERAEVPAFAEAGGVVGPLWGTAPDGRGYFDTSLPWVTYDPEAGVVYLDEDEAAAHGVDLEPVVNNLLEVR